MTGRPAIPFAGCFRATDGDEPKVGDGELAFIGLPDDSRSSYRHGSASGPNRIRLAYDGLSFNACTETGIDLTERVTDLGNWRPVDEWEETAAGWRDRTRELLRAGAIPFFAGGDHGVTVPIAEALDALGKPVHVVWIDAHGDLYPEFEGSRSSHACTGASSATPKRATMRCKVRSRSRPSMPWASVCSAMVCPRWMQATGVSTVSLGRSSPLFCCR